MPALFIQKIITNTLVYITDNKHQTNNFYLPQSKTYSKYFIMEKLLKSVSFRSNK